MSNYYTTETQEDNMNVNSIYIDTRDTTKPINKQRPQKKRVDSVCGKNNKIT